MRALPLALVLVLASCSSTAPTGQLGLPSARASTPAPTAPPRTTAPGATASGATASAAPSGSPGASGSPSTSPSPSPSTSPHSRPAIVSASATQLSLAVTYSAPMRAALACGTSGPPGTTEGAIDRASTYGSNDPTLRESLQSATRATLNADCTTVTFIYGIAAAAGTFTVTASGAVDRGGTSLDPAGSDARVTVTDDGRPQVTGVASAADAIDVRFSEPMLQLGEGGGVTMPANYRLDGSTPVAAILACLDAGCRGVRITLRSGTLVTGRSYELRIANTVDRAGKSITPDPTTITFRAG